MGAPASASRDCSPEWLAFFHPQYHSRRATPRHASQFCWHHAPEGDVYGIDHGGAPGGKLLTVYPAVPWIGGKETGSERGTIRTSGERRTKDGLGGVASTSCHRGSPRASWGDRGQH